MSVEQLWCGSRRAWWPTWNPCMWTATVTGGPRSPRARRLRAPAAGLGLQPHPRRYLYRLPVIARSSRWCRSRVSWEVTVIPGMWALHTYWMEPLGERRCRFGSWEVAEGPAYRLMRPFWLAHFRYVCRESLLGANSSRDRDSIGS